MYVHVCVAGSQAALCAQVAGLFSVCVTGSRSRTHRVCQGAVIIRQGDVGDFFYVVERGFCDIFVEGVGKVSLDAVSAQSLLQYCHL